MTAQINQDFVTFAGDAISPIYTVQNASGAAVDISASSEITWIAERNNQGTVVQVISKTKSAGQIAFLGGGTTGQFQVTILKTDTAGLSGFYIYTTTVLDASGNPTTVATGRMQVGAEPTWTYDATQIASIPLYQIRRLIGDVIKTDAQLGDAEINYLISLRGSIYGAAAECCRAISAQYARKVDLIVAGAGGNLKQNYSQQSKQYLIMASQFEQRAIASGGALPYAGGISVSDKETNEQDTDRVAPQFNIGMSDNQLLGGPLANETLDGQTNAELDQ